MEDKIKFEIEYISEVNDGYIIARILNQDHNFELTDHSKLDNFPIEKFLTQPRALDNLGNPRLDLFVFKMKEKLDLRKLKKGQILEFIQ